MKNILITGGAGYIGSTLAAYLSKRGNNVSITSRGTPKSEGLKQPYDVRVMDLLDESTIFGVCKNMHAVIHTATYNARASTNPKDILMANGYGTRLLLEDAKKRGVKKFIYLSTFHVYGQSEGYIDENTLVNPISDYALTHYVGEMYCNQYSAARSLTPIIVRITNGYGMPCNNSPEPWGLAVNQFCKEAIDKKVLQINSQGTQLRDFIAVNDIVRAIETLLTSDHKVKQTDVYNISSESAISINELAETVAGRYKKLFGKQLDVKHVSKPNDIDLNDKSFLKVSSSKLRTLGWSPQSKLEHEIEEMLIRLKER